MVIIIVVVIVIVIVVTIIVIVVLPKWKIVLGITFFINKNLKNLMECEVFVLKKESFLFF